MEDQLHRLEQVVGYNCTYIHTNIHMSFKLQESHEILLALVTSFPSQHCTDYKGSGGKALQHYATGEEAGGPGGRWWCQPPWQGGGGGPAPGEAGQGHTQDREDGWASKGLERANTG